MRVILIGGRRLELVALIVCAVACSDPSGPEGNQWTQLGSLSAGYTILDGEHHSGISVLVGLGGTVLLSNGGAWEDASEEFTTEVITGLTHSEYYGEFILGSNDVDGLNRTIATSPDGRNWTRHATPGPDHMREVACLDSICVAVGDRGVILRTDNLLTWEATTPALPMGFRWVSVIGARKEFVATGGREQIATSNDGRNWKVRQLGLTPNMDMTCVPPNVGCNDIDDIAFDGTTYVVVTHPELVIHASTDLITWTRHDPGLKRDGRGLWAVRAAGGRFFVGGGGGKAGMSIDGRDWVPIDVGMAPRDIWSITQLPAGLLFAGQQGYATMGSVFP